MQTELTQALTALEAAAEAIKKLQAQQPTQPEPQLSIKGAWYEVVSVGEDDIAEGIKIGDKVQCIEDNDRVPVCVFKKKEFPFEIPQLRHLPNYVPEVEHITNVSELPLSDEGLKKASAYINILRIVAYCNSQFEADKDMYVFDHEMQIKSPIYTKHIGYHFTSLKSIELAKNTPDFIKHFEVWMG